MRKPRNKKQSLQILYDLEKKYGENFRDMEILCACGCNTKIKKFVFYKNSIVPKEKKYVRGHNKSTLGRSMPDEQRKKISVTLKNSKVSPPKEYWFKKGDVPWNKGVRVHLSPNTEFKDGHKPAHAGRKRPELSGEKHWNWAGGITDETMKLRTSFEMKTWRKMVFEKDDYKCQKCGKRGGIKLNAHHIKSFSKFPDRRLDVSNGITLCIECHKLTHGKNIKK